MIDLGKKPEFGRIYSIWDRKRKMFRYVGQTVRHNDFNPHGRSFVKIWDKDAPPFRYLYCVERDFESIRQEDLNRQEARFILRRNTYRDFNPLGFNFTLGGGSYGRSSQVTKKRVGDGVRDAIVRLGLKAKWSAAASRSMSNPAIREKIAESMRKKVSSPGFLENRTKKLVVALNRPEIRAKNSANKTVAFSTPEHRAAKRAETLKRCDAAWLDHLKTIRENTVANKECLSKRNKAIRESHSTEEYKKYLVEKMRESYAKKGIKGYRVMTQDETRKYQQLYGKIAGRTRSGKLEEAEKFRRELHEFREAMRMPKAIP